MEAILGKTVVNGKGEAVEVSSFAQEGKVVGLYFSAHWCPPCRGFTPKLAGFYNKLKASAHGANFEMVFLSSDQDQDTFDKYFKEMPWLSVKYEDRKIKDDASEKFHVEGIPTLVILNGKDATVIEEDAYEAVANDPEATKVTWFK